MYQGARLVRHGSATRSAATLCDQRPLARGRNDRHCQRCCVKRMYGRKLPHLLGRPRTTGNLRIRKCTTKTAANGTMVSVFPSGRVVQLGGLVHVGAGEQGRIMRAAAYIGRVGTLAVALGVGAAVATGHGVAWADDTTDPTGSTSHESPAPGKLDTPNEKTGSNEPSAGHRAGDGVNGGDDGIQAVGAVDGTIRDHDDRRQRTTVDPSRLPARPTGQALRPTGSGCCGWTWSDSRG